MSLSARRFFASLCFVYGVGLQAQVMNAGHFVGQDVTHRIAFPEPRHEILDTVVLRGRSYLYLLDTGAPLCIDRAVQEQEHFPILLTLPMHDANGRMDSTIIVVVDTIRVGELVFCDMPALVLDLAHGPLGKMGVHGIIGGNMMRFLFVRFDGPKHEVLLADRAASVGFDSTKAVGGWLDGQSTFSFPLQIGDGGMDTVQVDSGMSDLLVVSSVAGARLIEDHSLGIKHTGTGKNHNEGLFGTDAVPVEYFRTASLGLGGSVLRGPFKFTSSGGSSRIGRELIRRGVFILDYPGGRYSFEPH